MGKLMAAYNPDLQQKVLQASRLEQFTPYTLVNRTVCAKSLRRSAFVPTASATVRVSRGSSASLPPWWTLQAPWLPQCMYQPPGTPLPDRLPFVVAAMSQSAAEISRQLGAPEDMVPLRTIDDIRDFEQLRVQGSTPPR
nr:hypothetical protein [Streptomyces sp. NRRL S-813]